LHLWRTVARRANDAAGAVAKTMLAAARNVSQAGRESIGNLPLSAEIPY
jgi:hypothetical protein